jgi:hypothetical protein
MAVSNSVAREAPKQQNPIPGTAENLVAGKKQGLLRGLLRSARETQPLGHHELLPPSSSVCCGSAPKTRLASILDCEARHRVLRHVAWSRELSDEEIRKVVTFLSHLNSLPLGLSMTRRGGPLVGPATYWPSRRAAQTNRLSP